MKIWIDLDNSPHVPLFAPIIEELEARGCEVVITARDAFQVKELADLHGLSYRLVGRHYGKHFLPKLLGLGVRALQLLPSVIESRPALAVSHGSRSQLAVSALLGIPSIMITDYEFARTFLLIRPTWVMVPEVIPRESIRIDRSHVLQYPGIKEDVYVSRFRPDPALQRELGLGDDDIVVTVRPPATEAHYHNPESEELFRASLEHLAGHDRVRVIVLPRNAKQGEFVRRTWAEHVKSGKLIFPSHVVDGLNLIWHSDLVISGGGTMNREAAALGVPVYSIFRGPLGAVDRFLAAQGRLVVVESAAEVPVRIPLVHRERGGALRLEATRARSTIVDHIMQAVGASDAMPAVTRAK
jgi:predicted glycosyltransferase